MDFKQFKHKEFIDFFEKQEQNCDFIDSEMFLQSIHSELNQPILALNVLKKDEKDNFIFSDDKLNKIELSHEERQIRQIIGCLVQYLEQFNLKITISAAFYLLSIIQYPSCCVFIAMWLYYKTEKSSSFLEKYNGIINCDFLCYSFPNGLPNKACKKEF